MSVESTCAPKRAAGERIGRLTQDGSTLIDRRCIRGGACLLVGTLAITPL